MNKKLVNFIVKKYLKWDKKNPFISISALLAFIGVGVGVMVLIVAMAIMNGTSKQFEDKLFTMNYPLSIYPKVQKSVTKDLVNSIEKTFPKLQLSPYITSQAMVQNGSDMGGGVVFGVDMKKEMQINSIYKDAVKNLSKLNKYDLIMGKGLKDELYVTQGDKVTLYFTSLNPSGFSMLPKMKRFRYQDSFSSGLTAYDKAYMYTSIEALQTILRKEKNVYDGIHIYSKNPFDDIKKIKSVLPDDVGIVGWWQQNGNFFSAMQMEKMALFIVLMLIILIASLNIISSLLMTVMSRRKEIALLLSLGCSIKDIKSIFLRLGLIIGFSGIVAGVIFGFTGMYLLGHFDIISLPADVYGTSKLPILLDKLDFIYILVGSISIVILSSYYPAAKATKIDVLEVLRNE